MRNDGTESGGKQLFAGVRARTRVALQRVQAAVAALGHQQRQLHIGFGEVRQGGVTELIQR